MAMKTWIAGEKLLAADLNANFAETKQGTITAERAGKAGDILVASPTSAGKACRSNLYGNYLSLSSVLDTGSYGNGTQPMSFYPGAITLDLSPTLKFVVVPTSNGTTGIIYYEVIKIDPATGAITSATKYTLSTALTFTNYNSIDAVAINATTVMLVYSDGSNHVRAKVINALDSSPSEGSEFTVSNASSNTGGVACSYISDSHLLFFFVNSADNHIKYYQATRSGTTITGGTAGEYSADASTKILRGSCVWGAQNYVTVFYDLSSALKAVCGSYDTVNHNFSLGSVLAIDTISTYMARPINLSDTACVIAYATSSSSISIRTIKRATTTLSAGTAITKTGLNAGINSLSKFNARNFGVCYDPNAAAFKVRTYEMSNDENTLIECGAFTITFASSIYVYTHFAGLAYINSYQLLVYASRTDGSRQTILSHYVATMATNYNTFIGIALADYAADASVAFQMLGITTALTGLTPSQKYVPSWGGLPDISYNSPPGRIGVSIASGSLVIQP